MSTKRQRKLIEGHQGDGTLMTSPPNSLGEVPTARIDSIVPYPKTQNLHLEAMSDKDIEMAFLQI